MPPRFFSKEALQPHQLPCDWLAPESIATHIRVLRLRTGDAIALFDDSGGEWSAEILEIGKRLVSVRLLAHSPPPAQSQKTSHQFVLVQSLVAAEKMDWIIQKATELGVTSVVPVRTNRSSLSLDPTRAAKKHAHWQAVAISACEQCGRRYLPTVEAPIAFTGWLDAPFDGDKYLLHPQATTSLTTLLSRVGRAADAVSANRSRAIALLIGPEGGFDDDEVASATRHGVQAATLGPRILRAETAGMAGLVALQTLLGDFA